jgi:hypothetical protein
MKRPGVNRKATSVRAIAAGMGLIAVGCGTTAAPAGPTAGAGSPQPSAAVQTGAGEWVQVAAANGPLPRNSAGFAYDGHSGGMLLSGGRHGCGMTATSYVDTWTLDGSTWQLQHPKNDGPGNMSSFTMAWDPGTQQDLALGVFSGCGVVTGMFTWNGTDWLASPQSLKLPDPSFSYTLTYDTATRQLLAVGSTHPVNAEGKQTEQTWTWDGHTWSQVHPVHSPPPLADAASAYDPASRRVILFGGAHLDDNGGAGDASADTWAWDGTDWTMLHPAAHPTTRRGAAMATDDALGRPILFGGVDRAPEDTGATVFADTWSWDNDTWVRVQTATAPSPRFYARMADDPVHHQLVLFGGALNVSTDSDEVWVYRSR